MDTALHVDARAGRPLDPLTSAPCSHGQEVRPVATAGTHPWKISDSLLAQMMTLGTADDVRWMLSRVSDSELRRVFLDPPIGIFNRRSWNFWHLRLGLTPTPELPTRRLPQGDAAVTLKPRQNAHVHELTLTRKSSSLG